MASVVESFDAIPLEQGPVVGPVRLTPIQRWFFERDLARPEHYNQSLLLEIPRGLDSDRLDQALKILPEHHDALRLRFVRNYSGWSQNLAAPGEQSVTLERLDLSGLNDLEIGDSFEATSSQIQASMNLEAGPICRVALFDLGPGRGARLLLAVHQLAVDGVSWRILLEDLATLLGQLEGRARPILPPKTTSVLQWAEALERESRSPSTTAELDFWLSQARSAVEPIPIDHGVERDPGDESSAHEVEIELDADWTRALLQEVPRAFNSQINDVFWRPSPARWVIGRAASRS